MNDARRAEFMARVARLGAGDKWATSSNPVKQRIGQLEIAWREGLQGLMEDIKAMYANFVTVSDGYDIIDVNIAAVKSLCIDKGVFTEEEYVARRKAIFGILDRERLRRQKELEAKLAEAEAKKAGQAGDTVADENIVDPQLVRMREGAKSTTDDDHIPAAATVFGGR